MLLRCGALLMKVDLLSYYETEGLYWQTERF